MKTLRENLPHILYCMLLLALAVPNILLAFSEKMSPAAATANILLPAGVIGWLMTLSPRMGRTVWFFLPMMVLAAFQIVLLALYGRSVIAVDMFLNVVTTSSAEAGELLGSLLPAIAFVCALYLPVLILSIPTLRRGHVLRPAFVNASRRISFVALGVGLMAVGFCYAAPDSYTVRKDLYPVNAGYNIYLAVDRTLRTGKYSETSEKYHYDAKNSHPQSVREICVLVIGETSRAQNWQLLGYKRNTNPMLSRRANQLILAQNAYSESNTTHKSVPMLLSPINSENFGDDIYNAKSLISAFREAGWNTAFITDQSRNHSFIDFFSSEADTTIYIPLEKGDYNLIPVFDKVLRHRNTKQLVVLHTYGSHFNYHDRYADFDKKFIPDDYHEATSANRQRLLNAYDNTIVATDRFLDLVIRRLEHEKCIASMLYASDHGEDIYEDGRRFLHASPLPSENQVHVPMIAWLSDEYKAAYPTVSRKMRNNFDKLISTSRSYCPTALALAGISSSRIDETASLLSSQYSPRRPIYLDDHNKPQPLQAMLNY